MATLVLTGGLVTPAIAQADELGLDDGRPRATYRVVDLPPDRLATEPRVLHADEPHILYLNRCEGGLTIEPGADSSIANTSMITPTTANFPPFAFGDAAWEQVMEHSREIFSPFHILVTDVDPGEVSHDEAIVCGTGAVIGEGPSTGGVAPFTCAGQIFNPITYTFPESLGNDPRLIAEVVAQEAAHAWGLDHEFMCEDPMTYLSGCGPKNFQDEDVPCGEFSARTCFCGDATQNSFQHILGLFGPAIEDVTAPIATITFPIHNQVFISGTAFDVTVSVTDDFAIDTVKILNNGVPMSSDDTEPYGPWPVTNVAVGTYELVVEANDLAGNVGSSPPITIFVTEDGLPPSENDSDEGETDGETEGDDAGQDDSGGGCGCTSSDSSPMGAAGAMLLLLGLVGRSRRRRRAS